MVAAPGCHDVRNSAPTPTTMPSQPSGPGTSPRTAPYSTGTTVDTTDAIGAATPMLDNEYARHSVVSAIASATPDSRSERDVVATTAGRAAASRHRRQRPAEERRGGGLQRRRASGRTGAEEVGHADQQRGEQPEQNRHGRDFQRTLGSVHLLGLAGAGPQATRSASATVTARCAIARWAGLINPASTASSRNRNSDSK